MVNEEAEKYKELGNAAFKERNYEEAIKQYNKALTLDNENAVYYSNRSAAWAGKGNWDSALADANKSIEKDTNFVKGYNRKGAAHLGKYQFEAAENAFKEGLEKEPGNAACTKGLEDVKAARARASRASSSSSGGGSGGGGAGGFMQTIMSKLQQGGKMRTYMLVMGGYLLFNQFTGRGKTGSGSSGSESTVGVDVDDDYTASGDFTMNRIFKNFNGQWVSYMQSDRKSDSMLLMLHRTSSSADVEFSSHFESLASTDSRVVAPDRPCHGFSPCPRAGAPHDSKWLSDLINAAGNPEKIAILAVGRDAIAQALALAKKKREVQTVLMMKPKAEVPKQSSMAKIEDVTAWLKGYSQGSSGLAAADALRWALGTEHKTTEVKFEKPSHNCQFTFVYEAGDEEDEDLASMFSSQDVDVKTESTSEDKELADVIKNVLSEDLEEAADGNL